MFAACILSISILGKAWAFGDNWKEADCLDARLLQVREEAVLAFLAPGGFTAGALLTPHLPLAADVDLGTAVCFPVSLNLIIHLLC